MSAAKGSTLALYLLWLRTTSIFPFGINPWTQFTKNSTKITICGLGISPAVALCSWQWSSVGNRKSWIHVQTLMSGNAYAASVHCQRRAASHCSSLRAMCNFHSLKCNTQQQKIKLNRRAELLNSSPVLFVGRFDGIGDLPTVDCRSSVESSQDKTTEYKDLLVSTTLYEYLRLLLVAQLHIQSFTVISGYFFFKINVWTMDILTRF